MQHQEPHSNSEVHWLIDTEFDRSGAHHMQRDEALARELVENPLAPARLLLYSWSPAAVSIGFQQRMESIDLDACQADGIDVVRRPTGGRAVLHANELTYGVAMQSPEGLGIYAVHNLIVEALLASLESLGPESSRLAVTGRTSDQPFREVYKAGTLTNAACFASSARHEVTFEGRKVIGSAQRRFGTVVLQHGSILLHDDHLKLPEYLTLAPVDRSRMLEHLRQETSTLSEVFGRAIGIEECANSIRSSFVSHICRLLHEASGAAPDRATGAMAPEPSPEFQLIQVS
jgi:lipoate-protein ligase A